MGKKLLLDKAHIEGIRFYDAYRKNGGYAAVEKAFKMLPADIVEPLIALSICFVALENILISELKPWRIGVVFMFGLVHGMGFAAALNEMGLPRDSFFYSLITFNIGVEAGQLTVILACYFLFGRYFADKVWYRPRIVYPLSIGIAVIAAYWTVTRIYNI